MQCAQQILLMWCLILFHFFWQKVLLCPQSRDLIYLSCLFIYRMYCSAGMSIKRDQEGIFWQYGQRYRKKPSEPHQIKNNLDACLVIKGILNKNRGTSFKIFTYEIIEQVFAWEGPFPFSSSLFGSLILPPM